MANNPIFSYTHRDYEGSRKEGLSQIPLLSKGNWTDLNATDPGVILLDYVHALVDMANYYQDHQALETFISTAKERKNIFRLAKQLSYSIRSSKGAKCNVLFSRVTTSSSPVKIPQGTIVETAKGIRYYTDKDVYVAPTELSVLIPCTQGNRVLREYRGTGISRFSNTTDAEDQSVLLLESHIDIDTINITDSQGDTWKHVDYITFSTATEKAYQVDLNEDDSVTIRFGDGERGVVPQESDDIYIEYVVTDAEEGKVGVGSIVILSDQIFYEDDEGNEYYVEFSVTNPQASVGGTSSQSSEDISRIAPGVIKSQDRAVTLGDFESLAKLVNGVESAKAYDVNTDPDSTVNPIQYHEVRLYIFPEDPTASTSTLSLLSESVRNYISKRMIPPTFLQVSVPTYIDTDVYVKVQSTSDAEGGLDYSIREVVKKYFRERADAVGEKFYPMSLATKIQEIKGVRDVLDITYTESETLTKFSVLKLKNVIITIL